MFALYTSSCSEDNWETLNVIVRNFPIGSSYSKIINLFYSNTIFFIRYI